MGGSDLMHWERYLGFFLVSFFLKFCQCNDDKFCFFFPSVFLWFSSFFPYNINYSVKICTLLF